MFVLKYTPEVLPELQYVSFVETGSFKKNSEFACGHGPLCQSPRGENDETRSESGLIWVHSPK